MADATVKTYPYSDDSMEWKEESGRYYITEKGLTDMAVMMRVELSAANTADPTVLINFAIKRATMMVYNFIHRYNADNAFQDYLIAKVPALRPIIQEAIAMQAVYNYMNGDMGFSADKDERDMRYHPELEEILQQTVPSLGRCILYTGQWGWM